MLINPGTDKQNVTNANQKHILLLTIILHYNNESWKLKTPSCFDTLKSSSVSFYVKQSCTKHFETYT